MLRVAIAGCHRQLLREPGSHNFASAFCANPGTAVAGVFDYGAEERAGFVDCWRDVWGEVPAFDDYERLLDEVRPDIVCIATRQTMHADQIEKAVAAGARGILCDKPLVTSLAELDRVAAACENTPLAFALDRRWNPACHALRSALAPKPVGEIHQHFSLRHPPTRSTTAVTGTTPCSCSSGTPSPPGSAASSTPAIRTTSAAAAIRPAGRRSPWPTAFTPTSPATGRRVSPSRSPPRAGGSPCTPTPGRPASTRTHRKRRSPCRRRPKAGPPARAWSPISCGP